jgi:Kef-type K+ transport system membrane component KefB
VPHGLFGELVIVYAIALALVIAAGRLGVPPVIAMIAAGVANRQL